ncbi:serine hydrolase domain-containing protein [Candidatus Entotheonella palauensis]|uniref:serine hydrolase domain-containing protein n=1 Tax=Candidatus Entotheonella palauensis TaxID=93172 RepID=UPI0015C4A8E7|nr:serine hydrolase domain-containing protein [Candidatus Entotheonella palauensis]
MEHLDTYLKQTIADGLVPGAVICVGHGGQLVWHQAYGAAATTPAWRPMHIDTIFDIASLTKVIATTSLVLCAYHEGICHLDDRLNRFDWGTSLPPALGEITLRQLTTHTGGFQAWCPLYETLLPTSPDAVPHILAQPLAYPPGTQVRYSDLGFILLGCLLERQYGQPLSSLFLDKVAQPLGLGPIAYRPRHGPSPLPDPPSAYAATEACDWRGRVLVGEVHDENAWAMGGVAGHAGLFATAKAVWQFAQALLDTAAGHQSWLPPELLRQSWQRQPWPAGSTRAVGWDTPSAVGSTAGEYFSPHSIGHLGFTGTSLWIDPDRDVIVVLCTNRVHPSREATGIRRLRPEVHNLVMQELGVAPL